MTPNLKAALENLVARNGEMEATRRVDVVRYESALMFARMTYAESLAERRASYPLIGEVVRGDARECSICWSVHGNEVEHACE